MRDNARPYGNTRVDVIVVGGGAGGLTVAVIAAAAECEVLLVDKAPAVGGTTRKSFGAIWIPNNRFLRESGTVDDHEACVRYLARLSRPAMYDARKGADLGLPAWEIEGIRRFVVNAASAHEELENLKALDLSPATGLGVVDYLGHLEENEAPRGRTLFPTNSMGGAEGGQELVNRLADAARARGARLRTNSVAVRIIGNARRVTGVEILDSSTGRTSTVGARVGVVFASGGFTHNEEMRSRYLEGPFVGGCAAVTNTGDFVRLSAPFGPWLGNMAGAWLTPIAVERLLDDPEGVFGSFYTMGDGMIMVNRAGRRVVNEKAPYNELARVMSTWDPQTMSYLNSPLIVVWDEAVAARWGHVHELGNPVRTTSNGHSWIVEGQSLDELAEGIEDRLRRLVPILGQAPLERSFSDELRSTISEFNVGASIGVDPLFRRGETPFEAYVANRFGGGEYDNPVLRPISTSGPYFATIYGMGTLDTKGGPQTDGVGRVLRAEGGYVDGLYAVGNCAASPLGQAYPGPGGSIGPIITSGFLTGKHLGDLVP